MKHVEQGEDSFVTDVRPTELSKVRSMSRSTNDVVDVVDKEELVVEGELVVALVLWLLDVIRVLLGGQSVIDIVVVVLAAMVLAQ